MPVNKEKYADLIKQLSSKNVQLITVSKVQSKDDILELYHLGQRDFGENYVQELIEKQEHLPKDIHWHFIGHLQRNKVKFIAPFIHLIQGVDSFKLLNEINKEAFKSGRKIQCLLQVHIAQEDTKFGLNEEELFEIINTLTTNPALLSHVNITGLMGMASFSDDMKKVGQEMKYLKELFDNCNKQLIEGTAGNLRLSILSMGMSSDFETAIENGSNMVRIGSLLFGPRSPK